MSNGVDSIRWKRVLRTAASERFVAQRAGQDVAAVDLHYTASGVNGTVVLIRSAGWQEAEIEPLLRSLDDDLLPDVDLDAGGLSYTVVMADVVGTFQASKS